MPTALSEQDLIAEQVIAKGRGWKSRELVVSLRAPVEGEPESGRIPVRLSSEREVHRWDWWNDEEYIEVLDHSAVDLSYARDGLPFCLDHWTAKQIGLIHNVRVEDGELVGEVEQGFHPDAEWVFKDIRAGIRKKVSIGYLQLSYQVANPDRKRGEVEIRKYGFMPIEGSSVCIPADYDVGFGRSLIRALRSGKPNSPEAARSGQEKTMKDDEKGGVAAAEPSAAERAAGDEALRVQLLDQLEGLGATDSQIRKWITSGTSVKDAKRELQAAADEEAKAIAKVRTGGAPDAFVRSPKGAIGRDGNVKGGDDDFGFDSPGEFFRAVQKAATRGVVDPRFTARAASGQSQTIDSDGGFAVPPVFMSEIMEPIYETGAILSRVDRLPISGNSLIQNVIDETSRVKGSRYGAVTHEWGGETDAPNNVSKVKLRQQRWGLNALTLKGFVTDDELEDAPALGDSLVKAFRSEGEFAAEDAIVNGDGNGKPLGILNSAALVQVALESGQNIANTAQHIAINAAKIRARVPAALWARGVWLMHADTEAKLLVATLGSNNVPVYLPPGGISGNPFGTIWGKPVLVTEYQPAEGTVGDLMFVALDQYRFVERSVGPRMQTSAHVRFWESEMAFKMRWRVDGAPLWKQAVTPAKGANTRSFAAALAARS